MTTLECHVLPTSTSTSTHHLDLDLHLHLHLFLYPPPPTFLFPAQVLPPARVARGDPDGRAVASAKGLLGGV